MSATLVSSPGWERVSEGKKEILPLRLNVKLMLVRTVSLILFLIGLLAPAYAARVVILTVDRTSNAFGVRDLPAALQCRGIATALVVARTAQSSRLNVRGDGYLTVNSGVPSYIVAPPNAMLLSPRSVDLGVYARDEDVGEIPGYLGTLGTALHQHGLRTGAIGSTEALLMLIDRAGTVTHGDPRPLLPTPQDLQRTRRLLPTVDVVCVDVSRMCHRDPSRALKWVRDLLQTLPDETQVIACCLNPPAGDGTVQWPMTWALRLSPPATNTAWYSPATRRAGIITLADLGATILHAATGDPTLGQGRACAPRGDVTAQALLAFDDAIRRRAAWRSAGYLSFIIALAVLLALLAVSMYAARRIPHPIWETLRRVVTVIVPMGWLAYACTGIWPTSAAATLGEAAAGIVVALLLMHVCGRYRVFALWGAVGLVVFLGTVGIANWPLFNQTSYLVSQGARFYGIGNTTAGLLTAGMLVAGVFGLTASQRAVRTLTRVGLVTLAIWILWAPGGANFGMGMAAFMLVTVLQLSTLPARARWRWGIGCGVCGALGVAGLIWYDMASGAHSHVAHLAREVGENGLLPLGIVIQRKLLMAVKLLRSSDWSYVLVTGGVGLVIWLRNAQFWWMRETRVRLLLAAGLASTLVALALNDSGVEPAGVLLACVVTGLSTLTDLCEKAPEASIPLAESVTRC